LVSRVKATTFAAALREKRGTDLQFNHLLITISGLQITGLKKDLFYFKKSLVV